MSEALLHIIITRFNVRYPIGGSSSPDRKALNSSWLRGRFDLFETYCLPSVAAQTNQNFLWWIYFDAETPPEFIERARKDIAPYPNFRLVLCDFYEGGWVINDIRDTVETKPDWILTSRLDNDDGLHRDFVRLLQGALEFKNVEALNFSGGIIFQDGKTYFFQHESNAFLALFERYQDFVTVTAVQHLEMSGFARIRQIEAPPAWLQVIHGGNLSNRVRGRRVPSGEALVGFSAITALASMRSHDGFLGIMIDNALRGSLRNLRDLGIYLAKQFRRVLFRSAASQHKAGV